MNIREIAEVIGRPVDGLRAIEAQKAGYVKEGYCQKIMQELQDHNIIKKTPEEQQTQPGLKSQPNQKYYGKS